MIPYPSAFARYVEAARNGREQVWRLILGCLIIALIWTIVTIAVFVVGLVASGAFSGGGLDLEAGGLFDEAFGGTPFGVAVMLFTFGGIWAGLWIALHLLHGRSLRSVLGAERRLVGADFGRALAATFVVSLLSELAALAVDPTFERGSISIGAWLLWLAPLTFLLFMQISAEEVAFRGYLIQTLAARFRSVIVWGMLPAVFFTLVHWDPAAIPYMNATILISIAAFAATATILVYVTGNLGAAMGVHFGMNFFGILLVSHASWLNGAALFVSRPLDGGAWAPMDAVLLAANGLISMLLVLWLLLGVRSPLRLRQRD